MALLFETHTFLVAPDVLASTVNVLERYGGTVVRAFSAHVTCGVVADAEAEAGAASTPWLLEDHIASARCFRALRLPVVYEAWVHACAAAGTVLPCRNLCALESHLATTVVDPAAVRGVCAPREDDSTTETERELVQDAHTHARCAKQWRRTLHTTLASVCGLSRRTAASGLVAYDPLLLEGTSFTTTQLPLQMKANVVAALQFLGATYSPHLTTDTRLVVYGGVLMGDGARSSTASAAEPAPSKMPLTDVHVNMTARCGSSSSSASLSSCASAAAGSETQSLSGTDGEPSVRGSSTSLTSPSPLAPHVPPTKLGVAHALGLLCVPPSWVQRCLRDGAFRGVADPLSGASTLAAHAPVGRSASGSSGSLSEGRPGEGLACRPSAAQTALEPPHKRVRVEE